jgi:hypothetical protein
MNSVPFVRLSPAALRECELVTKRAEHPEAFTFADSAELLRLQRAADLAHELSTEARTQTRLVTNPHGE